jgi:hypothetical protein
MKMEYERGGANMKKHNNIDILVEKGSITYGMIAKHVGVTERTMFHWFSKPMDEVQRGRTLKAIKEIKEDAKNV